MNATRKWRNGVLVEHTINGVDQLGRGTKIARVAQPIARAIDKVAGTKIAGCSGCKKMEKRLDGGMSIIKALRLRMQGK